MFESMIMSNPEDVALVTPDPVATKVKPDPTRSNRKPLPVKFATPLEAVSFAVPLRVALPGLLPRATVIESEELRTMLLFASKTWTTGWGLNTLFTAVNVGDVANDR